MIQQVAPSEASTPFPRRGNFLVFTLNEVHGKFSVMVVYGSEASQADIACEHYRSVHASKCFIFIFSFVMNACAVELQ